MPEFIDLRDLTVNYQQTIADAMRDGSFIPFRVHPRLKDEDLFRPKFDGISVLVNSHFFQVPAGSELSDLPRVMEERIIRGPRDIREIFALGSVIHEEKCEFAVYAPEITAFDNVVLKVCRWPDWPGFGISPSTIDPAEENVWDYEFIGFSD